MNAYQRDLKLSTSPDVCTHTTLSNLREITLFCHSFVLPNITR